MLLEVVHAGVPYCHPALYEKNRIRKPGSIKRTQIVSRFTTARVCALTKVFFKTLGRGLLTIVTAIKVAGLSSATTDRKLTFLMTLHLLTSLQNTSGINAPGFYLRQGSEDVRRN